MSKSVMCPEPEVFVEFLTGKLEEDQLKQLEAHLAECAPCGDTVRSLNVKDTFIDLVRIEKADEAVHSDADTELQELMVKLESLADSRVVDDDPHDAPTEDLLARVHEVESLLAPAVADDELGRLAHYRILKLLGAGGMGVVYQAEDTRLQRLVALKILRPSLGRDARERFIQEARAAAAIDHDNVVTIYNVGSEGPLAYLAMQWLDGETLESRLNRDVRLSPEEVIQIGSQIADGLAAAHAKKLIHRDIKPANILLEAGRDRAKILDFGLAQVVDDNPQLTETGMIAGTPAYMSPEQAQGRAVDERSDLFSLGTMLYRMLTGNLPFEATNALATIRSIQQDAPPAPRQVDLNVPASLSDLVMDLLEKDPRSRPENAEVVAESLRKRTRPVRPPAANSLSPSLATSGGGNWSWRVWVPLLFAFGGLFAAPIIYRIKTDYGEIVVETEDLDVQVEILQGGKSVKVIDTRNDDTVIIGSGTYELQLKDATSEVTLRPDHVTISRKGREVVTVSKTAKANGTPGDTAESDDSATNPSRDRISLGYGLVMSVMPQTIAAGSRVKIQVNGTMPEWPIDAVYTVEPSGKVALGAAYGRVLVAGMTYEEAEQAIETKLKETLAAPKVQVTVPDISKTESQIGQANVDRVMRIALKHIQTEVAQAYFMQLYPSSDLNLVPDFQTNSLLAAGGTQQEMQQLLELLEKIDVPNASEAGLGGGVGAVLYDGKPSAYWLSVLRIEKSPERLAEALTALSILTDDGNSDSTCETVFRTMRHSGTDTRVSVAAEKAIYHCNADVVTKHIVRELSDGNERSLHLIHQLWLRVLDGTKSMANASTQVVAALRISFSQHSHAICDGLLQLTEQDETRSWAQQSLARFCSKAEIDSKTAAAVLPPLKKLLKKDDPDLTIMAAEALARLAPDTDGLTEILAEIIQDGMTTSRRTNSTRARSIKAIYVLELLGPRAKAAVPILLEVLSDWVDVPSLKNGFVFGPNTGGAAPLIKALGEIGPDAKAALPTLKEFAAEGMDDKGIGTIKAAKEAIAKIESTSVGEAESQQPQLDTARLADCDLHVIGIYSAKDHIKDDRVYVEVQPTDKPIVLALGSYFATNWQLTLAAGVTVKQVIVSGAMDESMVEGLPADVPVLKITSREGRFWAYSLRSKHGRDLIEKLHGLTQLPIVTFQGQNAGRKFTVDGKQGRLEESQKVIKARGEEDYSAAAAKIDPEQIVDCKLHLVGVYGPKSSNHNDDRVQVEVKPTAEPIVLVLSSYESVNWQVKLDDPARVKQVIVAGYFPSVIEGLPDDMPVLFRSYFPNNNKDFFFGFAWHTSEGRKMVKRLNELTMLPISTFQGVERGSSFIVDGKLGLRDESEQ